MSNLLKKNHKSWVIEDKEIKDINLLEKNISLLTMGLGDYCLPSKKVPLSFQRRPFSTMSQQEKEILLEYALKFPEKEGRLTESIRNFIGLNIIKPSDYIVSEAHIDLTDIDSKLEYNLLNLGFEFDNFSKIEPQQYKKHYTLRFCIQKGNFCRIKELVNLTRINSRKAFNLIQEHPCFDGYVEEEIYDNSSIDIFDFKPIAEEDLNYFPFEQDSFYCLRIPSNRKEAHENNLSINLKRAADIHIKIPSHLNCKSSLICSKGMETLKKKIIQCGFYETISESANYIFTAHFGKISEARMVFEKLCSFARNYGGFTGIAKEICTKMRRKETFIDNQRIFSEVPPLLFIKNNSDSPRVIRTN